MSSPTLRIERLNPSGCPDPTAFEVLKHDQRTRFGYRPLVYVCSPFAGDTRANVALARCFSAALVERGCIPVTPHLLFPQFMDDADPDARELAMFMGRIVMSKCEQVWIYAPQVSAGMHEEARWARHLDLPITFVNHDFEEIHP